MNLPRLLVGLRMARRDLRRHPGRAALVVLMVLVPTAGMTVVTTFIRTSELSPEAELRAAYGQADYVAIPTASSGRSIGASDAEVDAFRSRLDASARVLVERSLYDRVRQGDRRVYLTVNQLDLADPMLDGRFGPLSGRLPATPGETVLTHSAARKLGIGIGGRLRPDRLGRSLEVVGMVRALAANSDTAYVSGPLPDDVIGGTSVFVADVETWPEVPGWQVTPAVFQAAGRSGDDGVFWTDVGGAVSLFVLGTVVAAAFAVGARRQLRTIGLLSSSGASPRTLALFLVAQGAISGFVGSLLGIAAGLMITRLTPDRLLESLVGRPVTTPVVPLLDLVPILVIGTAAAMVAAWLPARSASRIPTLQALAGRRPLPSVPRRLPAFGGVAVAAGCLLLAIAVSGGRSERDSLLWPVVAVVGAVTVLAGALAVAPWVVAGLERACTSRSQSWRLAGRSLARSRVRSSAVVGSICAVAATIVGGSTLHQSLVVPSPDSCCQRDLPYLRPNQALLTTETVFSRDGTVDVESAVSPPSYLDRIARIVPGATQVELPRLVTADGRRAELLVRLPGAGPYPTQVQQSGPVLATPDVLDLFAVPAALRRRLDAGEAIGTGGLAPGVREVQLLGSDDRSATPEEAPAPQEPVTLPLGGSFESPAAAGALPTVLVGEELASRLGLVVRPGGAIVIVGRSRFTDRQHAALELLAQDFTWETGLVATTGGALQARLSTDPRDSSPSTAAARALVLAVSLLLVLAVVAVGLALAAKDSEDERRVLTAAGAPPRMLRQVGTRRATLLVLTAALIAVPAGLLPAGAVVAAAADTSEGFRLDPWSLAFVIAGLPLATAACTSVGGRLRDSLRPSRPDVFAFSE